MQKIYMANVKCNKCKDSENYFYENQNLYCLKCKSPKNFENTKTQKNILEIGEILSRKDMEESKNFIFVYEKCLDDSENQYLEKFKNLPNSFGIITRKTISKNKDSYYTDENFEDISREIDIKFDELKILNKQIYIHTNFGDEIGNLSKRSPKIYRYLLEKISKYDETT